MPGQWEYQVGPCVGILGGDHVWMSRYSETHLSTNSILATVSLVCLLSTVHVSNLTSTEVDKEYNLENGRKVMNFMTD